MGEWEQSAELTEPLATAAREWKLYYVNKKMSFTIVSCSLIKSHHDNKSHYLRADNKTG